MGPVKTTIELPDTLFRQTKAAAALRGESIKDFVTAALRAHLESQASDAQQERGWRSVFGKASSEEVEEIDRIVAEELERIDMDSWR
jgi:Arc/MetJ family transcription regulator